MTGRTIVIGDIHGELDKLKKLISKLKVRDNDKFIFLGDYIDRGPYSKGVLDYVLNILDTYEGSVALKGNHEQLAIDAIRYRSEYMIYSWIRNGGGITIKSYCDHVDLYEDDLISPEHFKFIVNLPFYYEDENFIFVHGYANDKFDMNEQNELMCIWQRYEDIKPHKSGKIVVVGHTIQHGGHADDGYKIGIDTGSFLEDGFITAMVISGDNVSFTTSQ